MTPLGLHGEGNRRHTCPRHAQCQCRCWVVGNQPLCIGFTESVAEDGGLDFVHCAGSEFAEELTVKILQLSCGYIGKQHIAKRNIVTQPVLEFEQMSLFGDDSVKLNAGYCYTHGGLDYEIMLSHPNEVHSIDWCQPILYNNVEPMVTKTPAQNWGNTFCAFWRDTRYAGSPIILLQFCKADGAAFVD